MKKIPINKNDDFPAVVEKILEESEENELVLVVPRNSKLKETPGNFHLLKREAEEAGKKVSVESVDEDVLAFAEASGLNNEHPLFSPRAVSDIVPSRGPVAKPKSAKGKVSLKVQTEPTNEILEEEEAEERAQKKFFDTEEHYAETEGVSEKISGERRSRWKILLVLASIVLVLGGGMWALSTVWARADVTINFRENSWEMSSNFLASKTSAEVDAGNRLIPGEVFRDKRNTTQLFPATGRAQVSQKAKGIVRIFNAYSSEKQTLVATTRFQAPDGKIFRLDQQVIVPGAKIQNGKIIPSSIEANITADKTGSEYNLGPIERLDIPGFKGTPRFQGFYGVLEKPTTGGYVGERPVPTDSDIKKAEERMTEILRSSLENNLLAGRPKDFKVLAGASEVKITRLTVNKETDASGQFSVFGEAEYRAIGFREEDLRSGLEMIAAKDHPQTSFRKLDLEYSSVQPFYDKGELRLTVKGKGTLATAFQSDVFVQEILGKPVEEVRGMILGLPGLEEAKVSLWPIWLQKVPQNSERIRIQSN